MRKILLSLLFASFALPFFAQGFNQIDENGTYTSSEDLLKKDSLKEHHEAPRGFHVWTVDSRFGDRRPAEPDTLQHMYMNSIFNEGKYGEYNTLGNLGSPRLNRIFIDRPQTEQFFFTQPYDFFNTPVDQFHFTNTLSPITNLTYQECGDKNNGEDHLKALFAVNAGKRLGLGFKFNYIYARGYYHSQSAAHFNYTLFGSYLGDRYEAHLLMGTNHQKMAENGGITQDNYIEHPEIYRDVFDANEIPTVLSSNWNRNDHHHIFFTHRYNIGFNRKIPMTPEEIKAKKFAMESQKEKDEKEELKKARKEAEKRGIDFDEEEYKRSKGVSYGGRPDGAKTVGKEPEKAEAGDEGEGRIKVEGQAALDSLMAQGQQQKKEEAEETEWMKNEYVPVTSFIHTINYDYANRVYLAYETPANYYKHSSFYDEEADVLQGDSINDNTRHYRIKNTFAINLLEGFNKWAKAGLKAFITSDYRHFTLPDSLGHNTSFNEHTVSVGGQLSKTQGSLIHYNATMETWLVGEDAGQLKVDGHADVNIPLFGDTVQIAGNAFFHRVNPIFYQRHFHSKFLWWDSKNMEKETHTHIEGRLTIPKTRTMFRLAVDHLTNHTYFTQSYTQEQERRYGYELAVNQSSNNIALLTLQLEQALKLGILNWESQITYQKSSHAELPVPELNVYSNLYVKFKINKVLNVNLGGDVRWFTQYVAPDYNPLIGQYTIQNNGDNNVKIGNYPWVNVYANLKLKQARFYVMMSHVNYSSGNSYFLTPHYPTNQRVLRFGVSWNFFN